MQRVQVNGRAPYPVYVGRGLLSQLGGLYRDRALGGRALVVSDHTVFDQLGQHVLQSLHKSDIETVVVKIPPGETSKSLATADTLFEALINNHFDRNAVIVALGGGVVGDLAGFVAATYLRGVSLVHAPTTVLAQVDSAVGGKTGVNHQLGKNLIGAFHPPALVVADVGALDTLPSREWWSGMAEVIKYGLIADRSLFATLEKSMNALNARHPELEALIARCVEIKANVVDADEREAGLRKILNFGHTLGHALESMTEYTHFRHGEALVWGMLGEAFLSRKFGQLSEMELIHIQRLLSGIPKPPLPPFDEDALIAHARRDKKNRGGHIHMVWLKHIGQCAPGPITKEQLTDVVHYWRALEANA